MKHTYMFVMVTILSAYSVVFSAQPAVLPKDIPASTQKINVLTEELTTKAVTPLDRELQRLRDILDEANEGTGKEITTIIGNSVARTKVRDIDQYVAGQIKLMNAAAKEGNVSLFKQLLQALAKFLDLGKSALRSIGKAIDDFGVYVAKKGRAPQQGIQLYQPAEREMQLMGSEEWEEPAFGDQEVNVSFGTQMAEEEVWDPKIDRELRDLESRLAQKNLIPLSRLVLEDINEAATDLPPQKISYVKQQLTKISQAVTSGDATIFRQLLESLRKFLNLSGDKFRSLADAFTTAIQRTSKTSLPMPWAESETEMVITREQEREHKEQEKSEAKFKRERAKEIEASRKQQEQVEKAQKMQEQREIYGGL